MIHSLKIWSKIWTQFLRIFPENQLYSVFSSLKPFQQKKKKYYAIKFQKVFGWTTDKTPDRQASFYWPLYFHKFYFILSIKPYFLQCFVTNNWNVTEITQNYKPCCKQVKVLYSIIFNFLDHIFDKTIRKVKNANKKRS